MALALKIAGGRVLDGLGGPARRADVGIRGDRVAEVGDLSRAEAGRTLDAAGCLVCPGFIDVHSHSDAYLLIEPSAPSKLYQGVTTEVIGNCGTSAAPRLGAYRLSGDWADRTYPGDWASVSEYRALLDRVRPATNAVLLVGHNNLRGGVVGYDDRPASPDELRGMVRALEQAFDEGARGLSSGLIYAPGMFAPREEIAALCRVVAARGGVYATHMRSEGAALLEAIDEALAAGREAGAAVQISHLKTSGRENWHKLDGALARIRGARNAGLRVAADRYPYTSSYTDLDVVLPAWAAAGGRQQVLARLRDPAARARIRADLLASRPPAHWQGVTVGSTRHPDNRRFRGAALPAAAEILGLDPVGAALHFMDSDELYTTAFFAGMSEENLDAILREPWVMPGSDASVRAPWGALGDDYPHPRAYGTFARFARMALDGRTVPIEEAVRKMTSLPAAQFALAGRGTLAAGSAADAVVLDPAAVRDAATYAEPHRFAEGMRHVVVNGVTTLEDGRLTGARGGRVL